MFRRFFLGAAFAALPVLAGPPLSTIQDVLYKADGTRFSGTLTISWRSFQAVDNSDIVTQSTTVKVVDGNLRVQLVPTTTSTPPATYFVKYNSDGHIQFQETWSVPSSVQPLRVRDVRTSATAAASADSTSGDNSGPVAESDVVGLIADLGARPLKGAAYAAGRVAMVDPTGMLVSAAGDPSDCVHVDGSSGPCGGSSPNFVDAQSLTGIVDGSNTAFGLSAAPDPVSSLAIYRNGMLQKTGQDYNLTGTTVQFVAAATPQPGDTLLASFRISGVDESGQESFTSPQVLCSGTGASTSSATLAAIGNCQIPAGLLSPGDRLEVRFDVAHQGTAGAFSVELGWGSTVLAHRDAAVGDALVSVRADGIILANSAQFSSLSWGTLLPLSAGVGTAPGSPANGLTIGFSGKVVQAADSLTLTNFTVVRIP